MFMAVLKQRDNSREHIDSGITYVELKAENAGEALEEMKELVIDHKNGYEGGYHDDQEIREAYVVKVEAAADLERWYKERYDHWHKVAMEELEKEKQSPPLTKEEILAKLADMIGTDPSVEELETLRRNGVIFSYGIGNLGEVDVQPGFPAGEWLQLEGGKWVFVQYFGTIKKELLPEYMCPKCRRHKDLCACPSHLVYRGHKWKLQSESGDGMYLKYWWIGAERAGTYKAEEHVTNGRSQEFCSLKAAMDYVTDIVEKEWS